MHEPVHIVAFNSNRVKTPEEIELAAYKVLHEFKGKPVVLLFPEAVLSMFGRSRTKRRDGKVFARELHAIAAEHGNAFIAYSVVEEGRHTLFNSGYVITPYKKNHLGYMVYPKIRTYNNAFKQTDFDSSLVESHGFNTENNAQRVARAAKRVKSFPNFKINGHDVQFRVCADADFHISERSDPIPKNMRKAQKPTLLLVSASNLKHNPEHIARLFLYGGIAVINDKVLGVNTIRKHNLLLGSKPRAQVRKLWEQKVNSEVGFGKFVVHKRQH
jgi:predicted amidohydrolase